MQRYTIQTLRGLLLLGLSFSSAGAATVGGVTTDKPQVDVVFVLDTTGSMGGLIAAAKQKIWAIANTLAQAQPAPRIRMGLIGYRDRGDQYVTSRTDLTENLDAVYEALMAFAADGGGDGPESVNQALHEAVTHLSWRPERDTYKAIFLVGDAPPHMDYQDDVKYTESTRLATQRGIVINTIQCGSDGGTMPVWQEIAQRAEGRYFQVEQGGSAVAIATPYDAELARLSHAMDETRMAYGTPVEQAGLEARFALSDKFRAAAPAAALASRAELNAKAAGADNLLGDKELVRDVKEGRVDLAALEEDQLPAPLKALPKRERARHLEEQAKKREGLQARLRDLSERRQRHIAVEVEKRKAAPESLDHKLYSAIRSQAAAKGIHYDQGPAY
ncbi:MAG: vWA domain-containing protein [Gammaproteobacteria bacterium]